MEKEIRDLLKNSVFRIIKGLGFIILLVLVTYWLKLDTFKFILLLLCANFSVTLFKSISNKQKFPFFAFIKRSITMVIFVLVIKWLRGWGAVGGVIVLILFPLFVLWRRREAYMDGIRTCEKVIYGKTKEEMKKGERRPKIKVVLKNGKRKVKCS